MNNHLLLKPFGRRHVVLAAGLLALGLAGSALAVAAPPRIASLGIRNAASYGFSRTPGGIAPGSIFVVFGADLGPETPRQGSIPYPNSLPDDAMGTRVEFRSLESGTTVMAYLLYTSASQVMGILPSDTPLGPAEVTVFYEGEASQAEEVNILPRAVGIFTQSMDGRGPGVIQNVVSATEQPLNQLTKPALPGQYIVLWATGLGAIDGPDNVKPPVGSLADDVEVEIGGTRLKVTYAGRAPGFPGVDQINVPLPQGERPLDDCYVGLVVWAGDRPSQQVVFSAAPAQGPCKHPYDLAPETLADLDAGGRVALGQFRISRYVQEYAPQPWFDASPTDIGVATGGFFSVDSGDLAVFASQVQPVPLQGQLGCHDYTANAPVQAIGWINAERFEPVPESRIVQLDAGETLQLRGPSGKQQELRRLPPVGNSAPVLDYTTQRPNPDGLCCTDTLQGAYFESGEWMIEGAGGIDVGAFQAAVQLPPFPNIDLPQTVNREQDLVLSWAPDDYGDSGQVVVGIGGPIQTEVNGQVLTTTAAQVRCVALGASGQIAVPASLLSEAVTPSGEHPGMWFVSVIRPNSVPSVFPAPGIDYGAVSFSFAEYRPVNIE